MTILRDYFYADAGGSWPVDWDNKPKEVVLTNEQYIEHIWTYMTCSYVDMDEATEKIFYDTLEALAKEGDTYSSWLRWKGTAHEDMWWGKQKNKTK